MLRPFHAIERKSPVHAKYEVTRTRLPAGGKLALGAPLTAVRIRRPLRSKAASKDRVGKGRAAEDSRRMRTKGGKRHNNTYRWADTRTNIENSFRR